MSTHTALLDASAIETLVQNLRRLDLTMARIVAEVDSMADAAFPGDRNWARAECLHRDLDDMQRTSTQARRLLERVGVTV